MFVNVSQTCTLEFVVWCCWSNAWAPSFVVGTSAAVATATAVVVVIVFLLLNISLYDPHISTVCMDQTKTEKNCV